MCIHTHTHTHTHICLYIYGGFPGGSNSKESSCSVGDLGSIPGSRSVSMYVQITADSMKQESLSLYTHTHTHTHTHDTVWSICVVDILLKFYLGEFEHTQKVEK